MPSRAERRRNLFVVGGLAALIAFVAAVQVRSQAEVVRSLEGQDNTSLAFLIDDLHRANDALAIQAGELAAQRETLRSPASGAAAGQALAEEEQRLRVIEGAVAVHGPGVVIMIDAPLNAFDLQDAMNNLRVAGAEAVSVNDHRVTSSTVFRSSSAGVSIDGAGGAGPWTLSAIGDPAGLETVAASMTRSLRADQRVRVATYRADPDVRITATSGLRPLVYGST